MIYLFRSRRRRCHARENYGPIMGSKLLGPKKAKKKGLKSSRFLNICIHFLTKYLVPGTRYVPGTKYGSSWLQTPYSTSKSYICYMYVYIYIYVAETPTCGYLTRRHIPEGASVPLMALTNGVVGSAWIV